MILPSPAATNEIAARTPAPHTGRNVSHIRFAFVEITAAIGNIALMLPLYNSALKRLTNRVHGDLFENPVLWAELKSSAWADAREAAERYAGKIRGR
jgi:hypothetical protein